IRDDPRHRRTWRAGEPARRCTSCYRNDRRLRGAPSYSGARGHLRPRFRPRALSHAAIRTCNGHDHAVAPAWHRGIANALNPSEAATRRPPPDEGAERMRPWQKDSVLKVEHLTMRFGGLTA